MKAREVMTATVHAFRPDTPADLAAHYMHSHGHGAAPVTDDDGNLIGIVTATDLSTAPSTAPAGHGTDGPTETRRSPACPSSTATPAAASSPPAALFRAANPPTG